MSRKRKTGINGNAEQNLLKQVGQQAREKVVSEFDMSADDILQGGEHTNLGSGHPTDVIIDKAKKVLEGVTLDILDMPTIGEQFSFSQSETYDDGEEETKEKKFSLDGVRLYKAKEDRSLVPVEGQRIDLEIDSTYFDTLQGGTKTISIYGVEPNPIIIKEALQEPSIKEEVANFFLTKSISSVIGKCMKRVSRFRIGSPQFAKNDLVNAMAEWEISDKAQAAVIELIMHFFIKEGTIQDASAFSKQMVYPYSVVTIDALREEAFSTGVIRKVKGLSSLYSKEYVTTSEYLVNLGQIFYRVGKWVYEELETDDLFYDILLGIRSHIDPAMIVSSTRGNIPNVWRENDIIQALARNEVFVKAALSLESPTTLLMRTTSVDQALSALSAVPASLIESGRYKQIGKAEFIANFQLEKIRNGFNHPKVAILSRNMQVVPEAQAVFVHKDTVISNTYNIDAVNDRITEVIKGTYSNATFNLIEGSKLIRDVGNSLVLSGADIGWSLITIDGSSNLIDISSIAAMVADGIFVELDSQGRIVTERQKANDSEIYDIGEAPKLWYTLTTSEEGVVVRSGSYSVGGYVTTCDPAEVFLLTDEFEAKRLYENRTQLFGPEAFETNMVRFDPSNVRSLRTRFGIALPLGATTVSGSFRSSDFQSLKAIPLISLTVPHFNNTVIKGLESCYMAANLLITGAISENEDWAISNGLVTANYAKEKILRSLIELSHKINPSFRNDVHNRIINMVVNKESLSQEKALRLKAMMVQTSFGSLCDAAALTYFLSLQGINTEYWKLVLLDRDIVRVAQEVGTDRGKLPL